MKLLIAKVDETVFSGEVYSVTLPTLAGEITLLGDHMPLASVLKKGTIQVRASRDAMPVDFAVSSGVLEVSAEGATVLL